METDDREIWWDEKDKHSPLEWLRDTFIKVNNGRLESVSLPQRVDIVIGGSVLEQDTFNIGFIDTRGVDGTAVRPDLKSCLDDARTVTVLCSRFTAAPDATMQGFIEHGADPATPAAVVESGTRRSQRVVAATLETLAEAVEEAGLQGPALIIVGGVVALRDKLSWFEGTSES